MNGWDEQLKLRARREDCPLPQGFETRIQKELDRLPVQTRQQKRPLRRALWLAACLAAGLCLTAAAVELTARYFPGVGAVKSGTAVWLLEEPVEWTQDEWTYRLEAERQGDVIQVHLDQFSAEALPGRDDEETDYGYQMKLFAGEQELEAGLDSVLEGWETVDGLSTRGCYTSCLTEAELEQGFQTRGSTGTSFRAVEQPEGGYTLRIYTYDGSTLLWEKPVRLATVQALDMTETSRTFAEGTVIALSSRDGRLLDLYPDRTVENNSALAFVYATDVVFIGASGERYPAQMLSDGTGAWACNAPEEETITAVEIGSLRLDRVYLDNGVQREEAPVTYQDLNWVIPVA